MTFAIKLLHEFFTYGAYKKLQQLTVLMCWFELLEKKVFNRCRGQTI